MVGGLWYFLLTTFLNQPVWGNGLLGFLIVTAGIPQLIRTFDDWDAGSSGAGVLYLLAGICMLIAVPIWSIQFYIIPACFTFYALIFLIASSRDKLIKVISTQSD